MYGHNDYTGILIVAMIFGAIAYGAFFYAIIRLAIIHAAAKIDARRKREQLQAQGRRLEAARPLTGR